MYVSCEPNGVGVSLRYRVNGFATFRSPDEIHFWTRAFPHIRHDR